MRSMLVLLASLVAAGCAGYRGGWESVAYLEWQTVAPLPESSAADRPRTPPELVVPGLRLAVTIDNQLRTYDTQVYFFALPLSVDPRDTYTRNVHPGRTRVFLTVMPETPDFVFRPEAAVLLVAGRRFTGAAGFEFGQWDEKWTRVERNGKWDHRPTAPDYTLSDTSRPYYLSIDFETAVPSPKSPDIALDLSNALRSDSHPTLPLIRFAPARWKEGYT